MEATIVFVATVVLQYSEQLGLQKFPIASASLLFVVIASKTGLLPTIVKVVINA